MSEDRFESVVREWLHDRGNSTPGPNLARRIQEIPTTSHGSTHQRNPRMAGLVRLAGWTLLSAAAFALVLVILEPRVPHLVEPGSQPGVDRGRVGMQAGDGLVEPGLPVLPIGATVVVLAILGWAARRWPSVTPRAALLLVALVVLGTDAILAGGSRVAFRSGAFGGGIGSLRMEPGTGGTPNRQIYVVGPNGKFSFGVTITNTGPLPITVLGLGSVADDPESLVPRLVGLGLEAGPGVFTGDAGSAYPFHPVDLPPGGQVDVVVLGLGSRCAAATETGYGVGLPTLPLVTEAAGWPRMDTFRLPFEVEIAVTEGCS